MATAILTGIMLTLALQPNATAELDGRMLLVRLYADWENAPGEFEPNSVRLQRNRVTIEPGEASDSPIVVIAAEDQQDQAVKEAVGDTLWAQRLTKRLELSLPFPQGQDRRPWQFTDALGEPLPGAVVEIWLVDYRGPRVRFGRTTLDPAGRLARRMPVGDLRTIYFVVSHPDYGCANVREPFEPDRKVTVPLVRKGTAAAERAIHGRVVDPNGVPVAGATITCQNVRTLGEGLINGLDETHKGLTDANGVFAFYMPNRKMRDERGELIPPKSQYHVRIEAPKSLGVLPYVEPIENGRETVVVLERPDRLRRLRFKDHNGEITDPAKLATISVLLRRPGRGPLTLLYYDDWKDGAPLPPGTYEASMSWPHGECKFEPVELTQDSPQEVVFTLPAAVTYYGRVVHGITGRPMPGAFVLAMSSRCADKQLCDLTPEQWDALHRLASDPPQEGPALDSLRQIFGFTKLVRTDATGGYVVALEPDDAFYGFVTFERDYLAVMYRKHSLKADSDRFAEVPAIKLFPAATVFVETAIDKEHPSIMPVWEIDEESRPAWVQDLLGIDDKRESFLECKDWMKANARQPVHVPAGVSLRLRLEAPYDEEFCPILIPQMIHLMQGQTIDLGQFTFEPAIAVQVKAVDATGQAIEGIPIRSVYVLHDGTHSWSLPHNTDEQGIARFHIIPNSTGSFGVLYHGGDGVHLKETVDYKIAGPEDAGREFVLQISDEMLTQLMR